MSNRCKSPDHTRQLPQGAAGNVLAPCLCSFSCFVLLFLHHYGAVVVEYDPHTSGLRVYSLRRSQALWSAALASLAPTTTATATATATAPSRTRPLTGLLAVRSRDGNRRCLSLATFQLPMSNRRVRSRSRR